VFILNTFFQDSLILSSKVKGYLSEAPGFAPPCG
jgi:hypothetical protein